MGTGSEMGGAWRSRSEFTGLLEVKIAAALTPGQGGATVEVDGGASRGGSVLREGLVVTDGERELDVADVERMSSRPRAPALGEKIARSGRSVLLGIRAAGWRTGGQQQIGERSAGAFVDRRAHDDGDGAGLVVGGGAGLVVGGGAGLVVSGGAGLVVAMVLVSLLATAPVSSTATASVSSTAAASVLSRATASVSLSATTPVSSTA
ncbi:hypothetical protein [uncultured Microbacterium sp.]|uniref:hypothetical protein n=1 Tax=uncultured Microbacterium sp. TaxID=191216 RepID=UPI0025E6BF59|nr:hypothetical protein [uncultured Microbacterium sp.]